MTYALGSNIVNTYTTVDLPSTLTVNWELDRPMESARFCMGGTYGLEFTAQLSTISSLITALTEARTALTALSAEHEPEVPPPT